MYKLFALFICLFLLAGCGDNNGGYADAPARSADAIDLDLVAMSGTMMYAAIGNLFMRAPNHLGDIIRVQGIYQPFFWHATGLYYHYLTIDSALGCCPQGIEFRLPTEALFPYDFPPIGALVEITGVFSSYEEMENTFFYVAAEGFIVVE